MSEIPSDGPSRVELFWSLAEAIVAALVALHAFGAVESAYDGSIVVPVVVGILVGLVVAHVVERIRLLIVE